MGLLLWVSKPIWFVLLFWLAARRYSAANPTTRMRPWLRGILGGLGRVAFGSAFGWVALTTEVLELGTDEAHVAGKALFLIAGFALWLLVGKLAIREASWRFLIGFAAIGELIGGAIDLWAMHDMIGFRMC